jgi:hypothetical protein
MIRSGNTTRPELGCGGSCGLLQAPGTAIPLLSIPVMMDSRAIMDVHDPSDVLVGSLIGAVMGNWVTRARTVSPWSPR